MRAEDKNAVGNKVPNILHKLFPICETNQKNPKFNTKISYKFLYIAVNFHYNNYTISNLYVQVIKDKKTNL